MSLFATSSILEITTLTDRQFRIAMWLSEMASGEWVIADIGTLAEKCGISEELLKQEVMGMIASFWQFQRLTINSPEDRCPGPNSINGPMFFNEGDVQ